MRIVPSNNLCVKYARIFDIMSCPTGKYIENNNLGLYPNEVSRSYRLYKVIEHRPPAVCKGSKTDPEFCTLGPRPNEMYSLFVSPNKSGFVTMWRADSDTNGYNCEQKMETLADFDARYAKTKPGSKDQKVRVVGSPGVDRRFLSDQDMHPPPPLSFFRRCAYTSDEFNLNSVPTHGKYPAVKSTKGRVLKFCENTNLIEISDANGGTTLFSRYDNSVAYD